MTHGRRHLAETFVVLMAVLAGVVLPGVQAAAFGSPRELSISIHATGGNPVVTKDVWVVYDMAKHDTASIAGRVAGAPGKATLELMARSFPFTARATVVGTQPLATDGKYSFTVKPVLATRYWLEVLGPGSSGVAVGSSQPVEVYVTLAATLAPSTAETCGRPVCRQHYELYFRVPPSAAATERAKHRYTYFGLALSGVKEPAPPKVLKLVKSFDLGKVTAVSAGEYKYSLIFSFRIDNDGYYFDWNLCTKDTESSDGVGLPGSHGCGLKDISADVAYLG